MANIMTTAAAAVTVTTSPLQLVAANPGRKYLAIALPVAGTLWIGTAGVNTTGATSGYPVTLGAPFVMQSGSDNSASVYTGAIFGITTAICTPSIIELSS